MRSLLFFFGDSHRSLKFFRLYPPPSQLSLTEQLHVHKTFFLLLICRHRTFLCLRPIARAKITEISRIHDSTTNLRGEEVQMKKTVRMSDHYIEKKIRMSDHYIEKKN